MNERGDDYKIIVKDSVPELAREIRDFLSLGYEPAGGVFACINDGPTRYMQAVWRPSGYVPAGREAVKGRE